MAITKYESYYNKIREQLEIIKNKNEYNNNSIAFAHWYLQRYYKLNEQQIAEDIIDGDGDLGIDAVILNEEDNALAVLQFKFPSKKENNNNEISQGDILKTWNGFTTLIDNEMTYSGSNLKFRDFKEQLKNAEITNFKIYFVSYNKGIVANKDVIETLAEKFRNNTGSTLDIVYHDRDMISNIYEKLNRKNNIKITLTYKQMSSAYNIDKRAIGSYVGFVNGVDLVKAISNNMATIFDENIRLFEYGSNINVGISRTATSTDQANMFYFYNNGIVFICDKASNSPAANKIILEGASVVNGCQTLNVLYNAKQKGNLNQAVYVLVRIIEISSYNERMKITEYLNSQTHIKDSYFIANHSIVRDLQKELLKKGYFLERQVNEYEYMHDHGKPIGAEKVIQLETAIQYYVGYWVNKYANVAKRGKGALFDKNKIEDLLCDISADKVIEAITTYNEISEVLTMYRKTRRNSNKQEFAMYIGVSQECLLQNIEEFLYMNTGDIILLNTVANLKRKYALLKLENLTTKDLIIDAIFINREIISAEKDTNTSALTKSTAIFTKMQEKVSSLTERYNSTGASI
ncbi:AIPR family protein [Pectinatus frisingensis]|uniref:AIPR family protein n=1 Tax=Pectinatus frisingensis TaxID=865 RepID=UPI0018C54F60|nr:AIPR family protein [Pectinatus frisingensis]